MTLIQLVKELRLLIAEVRKCAVLIADRKSNKSEKPSLTASH